jgi:hypothetical protein
LWSAYRYANRTQNGLGARGIGGGQHHRQEGRHDAAHHTTTAHMPLARRACGLAIRWHSFLPELEGGSQLRWQQSAVANGEDPPVERQAPL